MTGMERNQDIIIMSSYAPLFANVNNALWNPNLIYFNGTSVYGTPSYYVQKIFGENRGDMVVEACVNTDTRKPFISGGITLSISDLTGIKDIQVINDNALLIKEHELTGQESNVARDGDYMCIGDSSWKNYEMSFKVKVEKEIRIRILDNREIFDNQNYYQWEIGPDGNSKLVHIGGFSRVKFGSSKKIELEDEWQDGKIEVRENNIRCYLNGNLVHEHQISEIPYLTSVTTLDCKNNELIVKMVNASEHEISTIIDILGTNVLPEGEQIILTSQDPKDNNSMEEPTKVSPVIKPFIVNDSSFNYDMAPYSLVVLKIKVSSENCDANK
jgi:alpha-N-arabinofuranosidase